MFAITVFGLNALLIDKISLRKNFLLVASYYFYMCWDWRFASLLVVIAGINYLAAQQIARATEEFHRKAWLALSLGVSLGILAFFKYANFFIDSFTSLLTELGLHADTLTLNILLPIGISFFTFQGISYSIDVFRRNQEPVTDFRDFALFIAFFPTVLSGPITRGHQLLPQFASPPPYRSESAMEGLFLILRGLAKKVFIADVLALHIVSPAFSQPEDFGGALLFVAVVAYSFQIYMDLSGYTDIARGIAKTLGFELPENFDRPYQARSVSNFWQRWHISMSSFFRDYLYFGVGGSKKGNVYVNLLITFTAIGMWHGAGWNFIVYGILHGSIVGLERFFRGRKENFRLNWHMSSATLGLLAIVSTFLFVALSRVLFRADDITAATSYYHLMFFGSNDNSSFGLVGLVALTLSIMLHYTPKRWSVATMQAFIRLPTPALALISTFLVLSMFAFTSGAANFVYFQF